MIGEGALSRSSFGLGVVQGVVEISMGPQGVTRFWKSGGCSIVDTRSPVARSQSSDRFVS